MSNDPQPVPEPNGDDSQLAQSRSTVSLRTLLCIAGFFRAGRNRWLLFGLGFAVAVAGGCTDPNAKAEPIEGESVWDLDVGVSEHGGTSPEVVIQDDILIYIGTTEHADGKASLHAFDIATGDPLWSSDDPFYRVWVTPEQVVTQTEDMSVMVRDLTTGDEQFERDTADVSESATVSDDYLLMLDDTESDGERKLLSVELSSGETVNETAVSDDTHVEIFAPQDAPSVFGGQDRPETAAATKTVDVSTVYVYEPNYQDDKPRYRSIDATSGQENWQWQVDDHPFSAAWPTTLTESGHIVSGPLQPNGDCNFKFYTAEVDSSQEPKSVDVQREQECDDPGVTVQADGEHVLAQDDKSRPQLVDLSNGESVWTADESGDPFLYGDNVAAYITGDEQDELKAVDTTAGKTLWTSPYEDDNESIYQVMDGRGINDTLLVSGDARGDAYVRDTASGESLWTYPGFPIALHDDYVVLMEDYSNSHRDEQTLAVVPNAGKG